MAIKRKRKRSRQRKKFNLLDLFVYKGKLRRVNTFLLIVTVIFVGAGIAKWQHQVTNNTNQTQMYQQRQAWLASLVPYAQELQRKYGVLASISLAQAAHESNWNNSQLSSEYHNFYGVKAGPGQQSIGLPTREFVNGQWVTVNAPFRVYPTWQASMLDHTLLLIHGTTDNPQRYYQVVHAKNYIVAANALSSAGYATDPQYAQKIIKIIELYHLNRFDR